MSQSNFPDTRWTRVRKAQHAETPDAARKAFASLCGDYWKPLYAFARASRLSEDEAQRLVNELFYRMTWELYPAHNEPGAQRPDIPAEQRPIGVQKQSQDQRPLLVRAEESGGRLRDFFMNALKDIIRTDWKTSQRKSLGGDSFTVEDVSSMEHELRDDFKSLQTQDSPEEAYRRAWRHQVLEKARLSLRKQMAEQGQGARCDILYPLLDRCEADGTAADAAEKIAAAEAKPFTPEGVRTALMRMRTALRFLIRHEIAETLTNGSDADVDDEYRALYD